MEQKNNGSNAKKTVIRIEGKRPDQAEAEYLSTLEFGSDTRGSAEISHALKYFFGFLAAAVALYFFGGWVISKFKGPGVLIFGYGAKYIGAPGCVIGAFVFLSELFRSAHKKKASQALQWAWKVSAMGDDASSKRFGEMPYAVSTMSRLLPPGAGFDAKAYETYLTSLRAAIGKIGDEAGKSLRDAGWTETFAVVRCDVTGETEYLPKVHELEAVLKFTDRVSKSVNNKSNNAVTCLIELHIRQCYIQSGKYWFPYDITPAFREEDESAV